MPDPIALPKLASLFMAAPLAQAQVANPTDSVTAIIKTAPTVVESARFELYFRWILALNVFITLYHMEMYFAERKMSYKEKT